MPTWLTIVLALGGSTVISLLITAIWRHGEQKLKRINDSEKKAQELQRKEEERLKGIELQNKMEELLLPVSNKLDYIVDEMNKDKQATILTLRNNLKSMRDRFIAQGYADTSDKATWKETYNSYRELGGNHFAEWVDGWKEEVEELPISIR